MDLRKNKSLLESSCPEETPGAPPSSPSITTPELAGYADGWLDMYLPPSTPPLPESQPKSSGESTTFISDDVGVDVPYFPYAPEGEATEGERTASFLNTVKAVVVHLLDRVVQLYRKEKCYGCQVDHPSQMQHECLFPTEEYYLDRNYDEIVKRLWTIRFIPALRNSLRERHLHVSGKRIIGAAEAILHNLRNTRRFEVKIEKLHDQLVENDETQLKNIRAAWAFWQR